MFSIHKRAWSQEFPMFQIKQAEHPIQLSFSLSLPFYLNSKDFTKDTCSFLFPRSIWCPWSRWWNFWKLFFISSWQWTSYRECGFLGRQKSPDWYYKDVFFNVKNKKMALLFLNGCITMSGFCFSNEITTFFPLPVQLFIAHHLAKPYPTVQHKWMATVYAPAKQRDLCRHSEVVK